MLAGYQFGTPTHKETSVSLMLLDLMHDLRWYHRLSIALGSVVVALVTLARELGWALSSTRLAEGARL
jgi:hypothetical protein